MLPDPDPERGEEIMSTTEVKRLAATAALAFGSVAAIWAPAAIANAYAGSCTGTVGYSNMSVREFSMQNVDGNSSLVTVDVLAPMSEGDAQKYLDNTYDEASFALKGDDPTQDRVLTNIKPEHYWASPAGLTIRGGGVVGNATLDEDNTFTRPDLDSFPENADEFYVDIRLHYISTGSAQTVESCRLSLT
jgi:FlaG/FlaF family flagellin (archaellin)